MDLIKSSTLPVLKRFLGTDDGLEIKVSYKVFYKNSFVQLFSYLFNKTTKHKMHQVITSFWLICIYKISGVDFLLPTESSDLATTDRDRIGHPVQLLKKSTPLQDTGRC